MNLEELARTFAGHNQAVVDLVKKSNDAIATQDARLGEIEQRLARPNGGGGGFGPPVSLGQEVVESAGFRGFVDGGCHGTGRVLVVKALTSAGNSGGAAVGPDYRPEIVGMARRRTRVRDLIAPGTTTAASVTYPRQNARTNAAAMVAEGSPKPESAMTFELVTAPVRTLATWVPVSRQLMDDAPGLQSFLNGELRWMLDDVEERELLTGDGTGQHLLGLIPSATNYSAPITIVDETLVDRIAAGAAQAQIASELPAEAVVLHPKDVLRIQLLKNGDGEYLFGGPGGPLPTKLWGMNIVSTTVMAEGDFLVGNFSQSSQIFDRMGIEIIFSAEASYPGPSSTTVSAFTSNMIVCRAERREALTIKRPAALVTGELPDAE